ncbi:MAG: O-antigen ligase family protein [Pseudomonadota bacterium]
MPLLLSRLRRLESTPASRPGVLEKAFAAIAMLVFSQAFIFVLFTEVGQGKGLAGEMTQRGPVTSSNPALLATYISIYVVCGLLLLRHFWQGLRLMLQESWLLLFIALAAVSALWSLAPGLTLSRTVALGGTCAFALYLSVRFTLLDVIVLASLAFCPVVLGSYALAFASPDVAVMKGWHYDLWRGVFPHKNILGQAMLIASLVYYLCYAFAGRWRAFFLVFLLLSLLLLLLSGSKSAILTTAALFSALSVTLPLLGKRSALAGTLIGFFICATGLFMMFKYDLYLSRELSVRLGTSQATVNENYASARALDQVATLTGRTELWPLLVTMGKEQPLLGFGYGGFWIGRDGPSARVPVGPNGWKPTTAHNGFLEAWLQLGFAGLTLLMAGLARAAFLSLRFLPAARHEPLWLFFPAILLSLGMMGMVESVLLRPNLLLTVFLVYTMVCLADQSASEVELDQSGTV